jgi:hypothetical protein
VHAVDRGKICWGKHARVIHENKISKAKSPPPPPPLLSSPPLI